MPSFFMHIHSHSGRGNKKLLNMVASSLSNREHHHPRRYIHHKCHCHPTATAVAAVALVARKENPRAVTTGTRSASNNDIATPSKKPLTQLATNEELSAIVSQFPPGIDYAFGYGSGVLRQQPSLSSSSTSSQSSNGIRSNPGMVDIIIATENSHDWHERNLQCHAEHYSSMARIGGPKFVTWLQKNFGAKLYFHPFVDVDINLDGSDNVEETEITKTAQTNISIRRQIKYGVVSTDDLIHDLLHWDYLYLAGRMHKPTVSIKLPPKMRFSEKSTDEEALNRADEIEDAQRINLLSAVSASLLLHEDSTGNKQSPSSPLQSFPIGQLYNTIASLSYTGDFRMQTGAEDPNKVKKLVESPGMMNLWENMYSDTLGELQALGLLGIVHARRGSDNSDTDTTNPGVGGGTQLECCFTDVAVRKRLVQNLPPRLRVHSDQIVGAGDSLDSIRQGSLLLRKELANIVAPAAKSQSAKGFFTAGVAKSWKYAVAKFAKGSGK